MAKTKPSINASNEAINAFLTDGNAGNPQQAAAEPQTAPAEVRAKKNAPSKPKTAKKNAQGGTKDDTTAAGAATSDLIRQIMELSAEDRATMGALLGMKPQQADKERKTYHLHVLVKQSINDRLEDFARQNDTSKAAVIEKAVLAYLDERSK